MAHAGQELEGSAGLLRATRLGDDIHAVRAPAAVRVDPRTPRSQRNEHDEPVELWAISRKLGNGDATKLDDFWEASSAARQVRA